MNKLFLLLFLTSCSSVSKFGPYKVFTVKNYNADSQYNRWKIKYHVTTENDQHCFESNPNNSEIVTVEEKYIQYAIDHFYKRVVHVDINVRRYATYDPHVEVTTKESVAFELEAASCAFNSFGGIFSPEVKTRHISFRLKK